MIDKKKIISWYQWININGRSVKQNFSGKNGSQLYFYSVLIINLFLYCERFYYKNKNIHFFLDLIFVI